MNEVDAFGAPTCFAPDYIATVLAAKMCTSHLEYSIYVIFLCSSKNGC